MATTANVNGAGLEPGDLTPEEADRFAAAFRPMWELDDAPFVQAPPKFSPNEVRELSAGGVNGDVSAALRAPDPFASRPVPKKPAPEARAVRAPRIAPAVAQRPRAPSRSDSIDIDMRSMRR